MYFGFGRKTDDRAQKNCSLAAATIKSRARVQRPRPPLRTVTSRSLACVREKLAEIYNGATHYGSHRNGFSRRIPAAIFGKFPLCFLAMLIRRDAPFAFVLFEMSKLRDFNY